MALSRRSLLRGAGALAGGALLAGCGATDHVPPAPPAEATPADHGPEIWRALSRLTFGPRPEECARAAAIGLGAWVEEQLAPAQIGDEACDRRLLRFDAPTLDLSLANEIRPENLRADLRGATLVRAVYSRRQLFEVLVDFWGDHFSVFVEKERVGELKVIDDREVIRRHALGRFDELLWASMRSPAMLLYLDNQRNHAGRPNENYARELLELHALGVDAGYSQRDVHEVARCLTGWTVDEEGLFRGQQRFDSALHDDGAKQLLGTVIAAGGGASDPERVHALLLAHPALPRFIARKLARRLVADEPTARLVAAAAHAFSASGFAIPALVRAIVGAPEFVAAPPRLKRPLQLVAGALRQLGTEAEGGPATQAALAAMGQPLFGRTTPDGFPDHDQAWAGAPLPRWRFALALAGGKLPDVRLELPRLLAASGATTMATWLDYLGECLLGAPLPARAAATLLEALGTGLDEQGAALGLACVLASPQYQWR